MSEPVVIVDARTLIKASGVRCSSCGGTTHATNCPVRYALALTKLWEKHNPPAQSSGDPKAAAKINRMWAAHRGLR